MEATLSMVKSVLLGMSSMKLLKRQEEKRTGKNNREETRRENKDAIREATIR